MHVSDHWKCCFFQKHRRWGTFLPGPPQGLRPLTQHGTFYVGIDFLNLLVINRAPSHLLPTGSVGYSQTKLGHRKLLCVCVNGHIVGSLMKTGWGFNFWICTLWTRFYQVPSWHHLLFKLESDSVVVSFSSSTVSWK